MPISGLAITLARDAALAEDAKRALAADQRVELGPQHQNRIAAITDTRSQTEDRRLRDWINALPGVTYVDITFIHLDDDQPGDEKQPRAADASAPDDARST